MNLKKWICLVLALVLSLTVLVSCNNGSQGGNTDGGDRGDDGSWDGVDFKGAEVRMAVSVNKDSECTFPAADIYTSCTKDSATSGDKVQKAARERNEKVASILNLKVTYVSKDLSYGLVLEDMEKLVASGANDSVDVYNNDLYGLLRATVADYLYNVKNPGEGIKNYFDFSHDGWYTDFMNGCTLNKDKIYVFSGDYFIDMVRMAWVLYVNADMFNANSDVLNYADVDEFYAYVLDGQWDYDQLSNMCKMIHLDTVNRGQTDKGDARLGLAVNHVGGWIFSSSSGAASALYQDPATLNAKVKSADEIQDLYDMNAEYGKLYTTLGVYYEQPVISSTQLFMNKTVLFSQSVLGELESEEFRKVEMTKGLVPIPKYDMYRQSNYHTMVHDQTEVGCILNNARDFSAASAFMQMLNEESAKVLYQYYEGSLKIKYNPAAGSESESGVTDMIDLVHDTIDAPFAMMMSGVITATNSETLKSFDFDGDAKKGINTVRTVYEANLEIYKKSVAERNELFNNKLQ